MHENYVYDALMLLLFSDGQEVAVVYFRNGYMPQNYISEQVFLKCLFLVLVVLVSDCEVQSR